MKWTDYLTSKTVWAAILGAAALIANAPKDPNSYAQGVVAILGAAGIRNAIATAGSAVTTTTVTSAPSAATGDSKSVSTSTSKPTAS